MRIIPIEIELDYWPKHHTARLLILHLDLPDFDTSLLDVGWYQGEFWWELFFCNWFLKKLEERNK